MPHDHDHEPELDDADLIAYLDGELEPNEAHKLESKLALDAKARTRAAEYKKTYDLLDYLPKPEPSADFTNRTLTRIQPALAPGSAASQAFTLNTSNTSTALPRLRKRWPELAFWSLAVLFAGGLGYGAHSLAKPYLSPKKEVFDQADLPLIHELPLFLGVDDLDFLRKLHDTDYFDDEPQAHEPHSGSEREKISLTEQQKLIDQFLNFPTARQQQLRTLYQQLRDLPAKEREGLRTTLEAYAAWLDRRTDAERKEILSAANGEARLIAIRHLRERLWRDSLPQSQKSLLARTASVEETAQLSNELLAREKSRREEWELAKRQWQPNKGDQPKPWPFSDPELPGQLDKYVKTVLGVDLTTGFEKKGERLEFSIPAACRLTREQLSELKIKYDAAIKEGYWGVYAECLYRMADLHPGLPRAGKSEPVVRFSQLPTSYSRHLPKDGLPKKTKFEQAAGKWPDFALAVHDGIKPPKAGEVLPPLGPSKPGEFTDDVNAFLKNQLLPALSDPKNKREHDQLTAAEGKWPEYSRLMMDAAKTRNLIVPGVSLPGDPELWAKFYKRTPVKK
jgi:hypothetical protein